MRKRAKHKDRAAVRTWALDRLSADVLKLVDRISGARGIMRVVLMPDVHPAQGASVGTVAGRDGLVYPSAIGGDIDCGMAAVAFNYHAEVLGKERVASLPKEGSWE